MIAREPFGRTGHDSSRLIFEVAALGQVSPDDADQTMQLLLDSGINHLDTAAGSDTGAGSDTAELWLGPWLETRRDRFFLATRTEQRTRALAYEEIERSLERLRTDHVDLIQLHNLVAADEWETAFAGGGALEAIVQAQADGLVRYLGVTGHGAAAARQHLRSLEQYPFDSVLLPDSYGRSRDPEYAADVAELLAVCAERGVAVQTTDAISRGPSAAPEAATESWSEPLTDQSAIDLAVWWVLGQDGLFLNLGRDLHLLPQLIDAAERFVGPPTAEQLAELAPAFGLAPLAG